MPALNQAVDSLKALNKNDVVEMKSFAKPPALVQVRGCMVKPPVQQRTPIAPRTTFVRHHHTACVACLVDPSAAGQTSGVGRQPQLLARWVAVLPQFHSYCSHGDAMGGCRTPLRFQLQCLLQFLGGSQQP